MASISLRAYNREIEGMIDRGQNEEAVAHCLHILQFVPKHIATYRLLGKALLEMQRYADAADIFQRVLSSLPDDFVAHVGLSIIRQNDRNLDAAIWHMERAFEAQPVNAAIQDELRRLYGRRDGMEPPKVRLTRGALARMYAKGRLYLQAIGELQAALAEDSQRLDLQVLLAQMYHQSGQREQAVRLCRDLLQKLPYCLEANRILADLLPDPERETYRKRLISLDPYYSQVEPKHPTTDRAPESAIVVERLSYQPGQPQLAAPSTPEWAGALDSAFQISPGEALPGWITAPESQTPGAAETIPPFVEAEAAELEAEAAADDLIPDFLKQAGWERSERTADEIAMEEMARQEEEEIAPAEIPDWLREIAPEGALEPETPPIAEAPDEELLPWLQEEEPGPTDSVITWLQETQKPTAPEELESLQAALQEASQEEELPDRITAAETPQEEELPDWISVGEAPAEAVAPEEAESPGAVEAWSFEEELPTWIKPAESEPGGVEAELPGLGGEPEAEEELPDWLKAIETQAEAPTPEEGWTFEEPEAIAGEIPAEEGILAEEWTFEEAEPTAAEAPAPEEALAEEWSFEEPTAEAAGVEAAEAEAEIPDWLRTLEPEAEPGVEPEAQLAAETEAGLDEDTAPWRLSEAEAIAPAEAEAPPLEPAAAGEETLIQAPGATTFDLENPDAALAWLESLAMQQGVSEDQLITRPEERPETPEWLRETAEEALRRGEIPTYEPTETVEGLKAPEQIEAPLEEAALPEIETETPPGEPAMEGELTGEPGEEAMRFEELTEGALPPIEPEAAAEEAIPDWLRGLEAETEVQAQPIEAEASLQEPAPTLIPEEQALPEQAPEEAAWTLEALTTPETAAEAISEPVSEELPEWLKEPEELIESPAPEAEPAETLEWGLEAELLEEAPAAPGEAEAALPEWLKEPALEEEAPAMAAPQPEEEQAAAAPEWLTEAELAEEVDLSAAEAPTQISSRPTLPKLDINRATLRELEALPGIGFIRAQSILNYREVNGPFRSIEALNNVPDIGPELVDVLRDYVEVVEPQAAPLEAVLAQAESEEAAILIAGQNELEAGNISLAVEKFASLIRKNLYLEEVIRDLQEALYRQSEDTQLWELLGDAYVRNNQLQEALEAYQRAEELLG